ncbi:MAG TPA: hypothetical protein VLM85_03410 [Polyangiaceae bacterium]|nr:hypothetical protein [Polyangiaceae bacterium]
MNRSLAILGVICTLPLQVGCGASSNAADGGSTGDGGSFPFTPSNVSLDGIDLSGVVDEDLSSDCDLDTEPAPTPGGTCLTNPVERILTQSDGSRIHVLIVKSLRLEAAAHLTVNRPAGGLPLAIVALGDMTLLGTIDVRAMGDQSYGGGFESTQNSQKGAGPGGGPAATGVANTTMGAGAGGGSYCGKGAQGALEANATAPAGPATAPYGTPEIVPLTGGSSGGAGSFGAGAGGGAVQLVAFGQFSMGSGSYINVGGGGGQPAVSSNPGDNSGGGGSGGSILIEATTAQIAGVLAANGGGGGGVSANGQDATPNTTGAPGGAMAGVGAGGTGAAGANIDGTTPASVDPGPVGGGGGAAGRIRINTRSGSATLTSATLSPSATTACVTQGQVK